MKSHAKQNNISFCISQQNTTETPKSYKGTEYHEISLFTFMSRKFIGLTYALMYPPSSKTSLRNYATRAHIHKITVSVNFALLNIKILKFTHEILSCSLASSL